jgi:hypothetical protein
MLIGCGFRRGELLGLHVESIQLREEHWVIADLLGKAGHIRTVPVPGWVKEAADAWKEASGIAEGTLFRSINKTGRVWGSGMTTKVLWEVVREAAARAGIEKLARMTFGALAQGCAISPVANWIRFNSAGACLRPDYRRYLGCKQKLRSRAGISWSFVSGRDPVVPFAMELILF